MLDSVSANSVSSCYLDVHQSMRETNVCSVDRSIPDALDDSKKIGVLRVQYDLSQGVLSIISFCPLLSDAADLWPPTVRLFMTSIAGPRQCR
jgi:hypothetical protein